MHCVVLQVTFVLQVRADQLSDCCWPVCADKNTTTGLVMSMSHCSVKFQHSTSTATQRKEPKSWCYAKVTAAKQWRASPGNLIISAGLPLCCSAWTSFLHCVVFPALSTPSSTMRAPLLHAIIPRLLLTIGKYELLSEAKCHTQRKLSTTFARLFHRKHNHSLPVSFVIVFFSPTLFKWQSPWKLRQNTSN